MTDLGPNQFTVTCVKENEDGSADVEVEAGEGVKEKLIEEGVNFLLLKGILEGATEDILRWAERGKQEELKTNS
jgi:hypothetical protein